MAFEGATWVSAPNLQTARGSLAVAVFNNILYAVGGDLGPIINPLTTVEQFNGVAWSATPASMVTKRFGHAVAVL